MSMASIRVGFVVTTITGQPLGTRALKRNRLYSTRNAELFSKMKDVNIAINETIADGIRKGAGLNKTSDFHIIPVGQVTG